MFHKKIFNKAIKGFFVYNIIIHITIRLRLKQTICMAFSQNTGVNIKIIL